MKAPEKLCAGISPQRVFFSATRRDDTLAQARASIIWAHSPAGQMRRVAGRNIPAKVFACYTRFRPSHTAQEVLRGCARQFHKGTVGLQNAEGHFYGTSFLKCHRSWHGNSAFPTAPGCALPRLTGRYGSPRAGGSARARADRARYRGRITAVGIRRRSAG